MYAWIVREIQVYVKANIMKCYRRTWVEALWVSAKNYFVFEKFHS